MKTFRLLVAVLSIGLLAVLLPQSADISVAQPLASIPTGDVIAFTHGSTHFSNDTEIYIVKPDGSHLTRLTNNNYPDWNPTISPDGRKLAFHARPTPGDSHLYVMDLVTGNVRFVSDKVSFGPYPWSPDSKKVLTHANPDGSGTKLYIVNVQTGTLSVVPGSLVGDQNVDWSPDGSQAVFINRTLSPPGVFTMNLDGTNRQLLTPSRGRDPDWSPDGTKVAYEQQTGRLHIINADGTNDVYHPTGYIALEPSWSPDGTQIAYKTLWMGHVGIINADGTGDHVVPNVPSGWIDGVDWGTIVASVDIDIKPGSDPNAINCNNDNGVIAVAILTTDEFDATIVDHATVEFEGAGETHVDRRTGEPRRHEEDVDSDGDTDLVLHFRLGNTDLTCGFEIGILEGETLDGQAIKGVDSVRMIDRGGRP